MVRPVFDDPQVIAMVVGLLSVFGLRIIDWYLPRGWVSKWAKRHGEKSEDE